MRFIKYVTFFFFFLLIHTDGFCLSEEHIDGNETYDTPFSPQNTHIQFIDQEQLKLTITPNPVESTLQLSLKSSVSDEAQVLIYNSLGVLIKEVYISFNNGTSQFEIPVSNIHPGLYFLSIKGKIVNTTGRFIKR
ncbi:MAG: T9SS type A sorting domain-containing protein [Sporocytophaga sp.]|uniref:T9SS type A sorting domain-containing protein n=1 Tax=Sporocytophaga sp. TaxID=2231183 RepID=UPI001B040F3D|nr:T9SS type A sorting domain-containing protein [Sporocytophaga sp.]MBO9702009.1 T9SS type A sorting domain-containing protein [Sporocytophaga sp.]